MEIREATTDDSDTIRAIAEQSFQASYALSPLDIETIVDIEFRNEHLESRLGDGETFLLVAVDDDTLAGFTEGRITAEGQGEIVWLHVEPTARGQGIGTKLFESLSEKLRDAVGEQIRATVLADNQEGGEFFERFEFVHNGRTKREFGDNTLHVEIYVVEDEERPFTEDDSASDQSPNTPVPEEITVDGTTRFIDRSESVSGKKGEFVLVFETEQHEDRFGFYCVHCDSFTSSVDGLGKIVCEQCGNVHTPEEWDGSYL